MSSATTVPSAPSPTQSHDNGMNGNGSTNSPLLFFVALGFGVVFTNLWYVPINIGSSSTVGSAGAEHPMRS